MEAYMSPAPDLLRRLLSRSLRSRRRLDFECRRQPLLDDRTAGGPRGSLTIAIEYGQPRYVVSVGVHAKCVAESHARRRYGAESMEDEGRDQRIRYPEMHGDGVDRVDLVGEKRV